MKITVVGGGNMGGAIALGLSSDKDLNITVINRRKEKAEEFSNISPNLNSVVNDYSSLQSADIIILAIKPWLIEDFLQEHHTNIDVNVNQLIISVAAGVTLDQLTNWSFSTARVYRLIPNTAIAVKQSMTFVASKNTTKEQDLLVSNLFESLGKVLFIEEKLFPAVTSLSSCGIAYAFRYIRASMVGGIEIGIKSDQAKDIIIQTLRGAIDLLEANKTNPETEIDKVTTPGGITIKGLNELEHNGFTSAIIRGLKASNVGK